MNIGIVTICYNGYGRFIKDWCESIARLTTVPDQVTIVALGENHGLGDINYFNILSKVPKVKIVYVKEFKNMGDARNIAVRETPTEWIMYFSADDVIVKDALEEFEKYKDSDVIAISYLEESHWGQIHQTRTKLAPKNLTKENILDWKKCFIIGHSPFRRSMWEKSPFIDGEDGEYPNYPFWFGLAKLGARFARTDKPCTIYRYRHNGHFANHRKGETHKKIVEIIKKYN